MVDAPDLLEELAEAAGYELESGGGTSDHHLAEGEITAWDKRWRVTVERLP